MKELKSNHWVFMPHGLRGVICALLFAWLLVLLAVDGVLNWESFADLPSLQFVSMLVLVNAAYLQFRRSISFFHTMTCVV